MTSTATRRLINSIIRNHFGESVQFVVDVLLLKGALPIATIVQLTGLSGKLVREALFVLIHHSLLQYNQSPNSPIITYCLDSDAILSRIGFGLILAKVSEKYSSPVAELLLEIIVAGRFKVVTPDDDNLKCLLKEEIIEIVTNEMGQYSLDAVEVREKRRLNEESLSSTSELFVRFRSKETVFKYIFIDKVAEVVSRRLNSSSGKVVETILSLSNDDFRTNITFNTFQLSQKLPKDISFPLETGPSSSNSLVASPLLQYLHILCQNFDFIQAQSSVGSNAFQFDIKKALRHMRLILIESFIRARFGLPSARIFKILLTKKMFEERQIAKVAMITGKEVRERLYSLLKVGLVQLQEVPKSADHAPSRTIFLWSVPEKANYLQPSKSALFRNFASKLVIGIINLRDLIVLEGRKHAQLLEKVERTDVANNLDLLNPIELKQLNDLKKIFKVLNVKIDEIYSEFLIFNESQ